MPVLSSIKGAKARSLSLSQNSTRKREYLCPNTVHHVQIHSYVWKIVLVSLRERRRFHSSLPTSTSSRRVMILVSIYRRFIAEWPFVGTPTCTPSV